MTYKTKKAAREAGLKTSDEWARDYSVGPNGLVPRRKAPRVIVKGEHFFARDDCEELVSASQAKRRKRTVPPTATAVRQRYHSNGRFYYDVFRESDCVEKPQRRIVPPVKVDLLLAVFTVNRSAKRYRDAAQNCYEQCAHGFARFNRIKKERLYGLKDKGIIQAHQFGLIEFVGIHGGLAMYRGKGYCFHSTLLPPDEQCQTETSGNAEIVYVEAKPKSAKEARLKDAEYTIQSLHECTSDYQRLTRPQFPRENRMSKGLLFQTGWGRWKDDDQYDEDDEDERETIVRAFGRP